MIETIRYLSWASLALFIVSAWGLQYLSLTPDNRVLMDPTDPRVLDLEAFEKEFRAQNIVGIVVSCPSSDAACWNELAGHIRALHDLAYSLPFSVRVESLASHPEIASDDQSVERLDFLDTHCENGCPKGLFDEKQLASIHRLVNEQGRSMAVFASLDFNTSQTSAVFEVHEQLLEIEQRAILPENATIHFVGRIPLMYAFIEASVDEIFGYMGLAIVLIAVLLFLAFGNVLLALTSLTLSVATIVTTLGIAGWNGLVLSTGSAAVSTVILTLTTATAMHYFMHIVRVMSEDPFRDQRKTAYGAVSYQFAPICLTALTTFIAMLSMLLVDSPPFRDLGLWTAVSMPVCCIYLFTVVPRVVERIPKLEPSRWQLTLQPVLNRYARASADRGWRTIAALFLALLAATSIARLELDDDFVRYFSEETKFRYDTEHVSRTLIGPTNVELSVTTSSSVYDPQFLTTVEQFANQIRALPGVENVFSFVDVLDFFSPHLSEISWRELDGDSISQIALAYEMSLVDGQSKDDLISLDDRSMRISIVAVDMSSSEIVALDRELSRLAQRADLEVVVTGEAIPISYLSANNIPNIALSLLISILATSLALGFYFRDLRLGGIIFVTTIVPIICGFGVWTFFEESIGIAATIILCICTGVVIDDTVHMVHRFSYARNRMGMDIQEAVPYTVQRVGNAICTTTLILAVGFGVLAFSSFKVNSAFGACTVLILVGALLIDLLVLPSLLTYTSSKTGSKREPPNDHR
jgi:predicted RND superfamily exporter protein